MWGEDHLNIQRQTVPHPHLCELPQAAMAVASQGHKEGSAPMTPGDDVNELVKVAVRICLCSQVGFDGWWVIREEIRKRWGWKF